MALLAVALVSGAALTAQVALTRVLAIAQGYHFAFLVISLALLGFGASGTLLAVAARLAQPRMWPWYALAPGVATGGAFLFLDAFPFDPYLVARDTTELLLLFADLIALALPFLFAGLLIGAMLSRTTERAGAVYGANLLGSGVALAAALSRGRAADVSLAVTARDRGIVALQLPMSIVGPQTTTID